MIKIRDGREYEGMNEWMRVICKYYLLKDKNILEKFFDLSEF